MMLATDADYFSSLQFAVAYTQEMLELASLGQWSAVVELEAKRQKALHILSIAMVQEETHAAARHVLQELIRLNQQLMQLTDVQREESFLGLKQNRIAQFYHQQDQ